MKLRALRLHNVRRFAGRGVAIENIGDGVNVLTAANEFGKSTAFEALHALFFQPHSGTPGGVQMLRPYAGGNPLVEADIETEAGRFRLTKQFYSGRRASVTDLANGRLVAQADEAESFISALTRGGAGGPAGILWVRQGITGIEKRSKSEEESDRRVREGLLSSVQGEVEALTGGRRMAEITASCEEALARLVTATGRPKTGGPFMDAIEERDRLAALEQQLAADVKNLRDALDNRRAATRRLAEIEAPEEVAARTAAITSAEEAYQSARSHSETLRAAESELALVTEQHRIAEDALAQFEAALARAEQIERQIAPATQRQHLAQAQRAAAIADGDRLQADIHAAETAEREARQNKQRLDAAQIARDAAERFDAAKTRLDQAQTIRARIEAGEARLATLDVPEKALQQLADLDIDLVRQRAIQSASLPSLRITYTDPARPGVSLAGAPIPHEAEQTFSGTVDLDIAGTGRLTIRSQHTDNAADAIAAIEAKTRSLLAGIGVETLAAARQRQSEARDQANAITLDRQLLAQLAPEGIERLREDLARLDAARQDGIEIKFDTASILAALTAAENTVTATRNAARQHQPTLAATQQEVIEAQAALAEFLATRSVLEGALGPSAERPVRLANLQSSLVTTEQKRRTAEDHIAPLRAKAQDLAATEAALKRVRAVANAAAQEIAQHKEILADLNGQIRTQADKAIEETWQETTELLAAATERARRYDIEVKTLDRLKKALASARSSARDLYLKPVLSELRPLIGLLFDDISITFNEDTLLPESVLRAGQAEDVDRLSGGMREQLSILTRLAFARLLARDGRPAPVILDDALVYSDDDRIERMFEALHSQSSDQQILVFSCRQRAFSKLGGNVLTMEAWQPGG